MTAVGLIEMNGGVVSVRPGQEALYAGDPALPKVVLLKPAVRDGAITNTFLAWVGFARIESFKTSMYF